MTWTIRANDPDGQEYQMLADTPEIVVEIYRDQRQRGRNVIIRSAEGHPVAKTTFGLRENE